MQCLCLPPSGSSGSSAAAAAGLMISISVLFTSGLPKNLPS